MTFLDWFKERAKTEYDLSFKQLAEEAWNFCEKETASSCIEICARRYAEYLDAESDCARCNSITHCGECVANEIIEKFNLEDI